MIAEDFNPDDFQKSRQRELDKNLLVKFYYHPLENKALSEREGRPIFEDRVYIDIRTPGERDAIRRPASSADIARFQEHYDAFMRRTEQPEETGTLLSEWPLITRSQVEELAFFNCKTVEHLANMADSAAQNFRGIQSLKQRAKHWLEETKGKEELEKEFTKREAAMQETLDEYREELKSLREELDSLKTPKVTKKATKKRGRPPKVKNASDTDSDGQ